MRWKPAFCAQCVCCNCSFYQEVKHSVCDYRDGRFLWTMRLHQILFQVRENCYRMLWNVEDSFWGTSYGSFPNISVFSQFKAGRTLIDDDKRSGQPVSSSTPEMIERVHQIIREDPCRTIDEVSMLVGISHGTCHNILTEDSKMTPECRPKTTTWRSLRPERKCC